MHGGAFYEFCNFVNQTNENSAFLHNLPDKTAFQFMLKADILVATGSSFPYVASELSSDDQIVISMPPKEANSFGIYDRGDFIRVDFSGSMPRASQEGFRRRFKHISGLSGVASVL